MKESNSKNFLGRDIFKNVKINYYSIYFQDQKKNFKKTHACCILDAFVIHRNMKNSKNNAQFSPSYVPILVCNFSIYVYNSCYTYQMFCFVCFFSLIKAFRLITISLNLSQRQYYITFSFIERDRE